MEALIGIVGALIGAAGALAATLIASRRERAAEYKKEVRLAVAELTRSLGTAGHSIDWLTWKAQFTDTGYSKESIGQYNAEMHKELPKILGDLAVVSALDRDVYLKVRPLVRELLTLDAAVAKETVTFDADQTASAQAVAKYLEGANEFSATLDERVADILKDIYPRKRLRTVLGH